MPVPESHNRDRSPGPMAFDGVSHRQTGNAGQPGQTGPNPGSQNQGQWQGVAQGNPQWSNQGNYYAKPRGNSQWHDPRLAQTQQFPNSAYAPHGGGPGQQWPNPNRSANNSTVWIVLGAIGAVVVLFIVVAVVGVATSKNDSTLTAGDRSSSDAASGAQAIEQKNAPAAGNPVEDAGPVDAATADEPDQQDVAAPAGTEGTVRFEAETSDGSSISVTYTNTASGVGTSQDNDTSSPWSKEIQAEKHDPLLLSLLAQQNGSGEVTCRILVDGAEVASNTSSGPYAVTTCTYSDFLR